MNIIIKATNLELTPALKSYTEKRLSSIEKFDAKGSRISVELGKTTNHHKSGEIFRAEINISTSFGKHRVVSEKEDLYEAIDDAKNEIVRELTSSKDKQRTLWKRGSQKIKEMMRGGYDAVRGFNFRKKK